MLLETSPLVLDSNIQVSFWNFFLYFLKRICDFAHCQGVMETRQVMTRGTGLGTGELEWGRRAMEKHTHYMLQETNYTRRPLQRVCRLHRDRATWIPHSERGNSFSCMSYYPKDPRLWQISHLLRHAFLFCRHRSCHDTFHFWRFTVWWLEMWKQKKNRKGKHEQYGTSSLTSLAPTPIKAFPSHILW